MQSLIYVSLVLIGLFGFAVMLFWLKDVFVRKGREEDAAEKFTEHFDRLGVSRSLSSGVQDYLQTWMNDPDFPVRPGDDLHLIYGIVDEDLDDLIIEVSEANDLETPSDTTYWTDPIRTVDELVRFIDSFPPMSRI